MRFRIRTWIRMWESISRYGIPYPDMEFPYPDMESHIRMWNFHIRIWDFHIRIWNSMSKNDKSPSKCLKTITSIAKLKRNVTEHDAALISSRKCLYMCSDMLLAGGGRNPPRENHIGCIKHLHSGTLEYCCKWHSGNCRMEHGYAIRYDLPWSWAES